MRLARAVVRLALVAACCAEATIGTLDGANNEGPWIWAFVSAMTVKLLEDDR